MSRVLVLRADSANPSYISSMSDYQVRNMSGSYAPTNGIDTINEATPAAWLTGVGSRNSNVVAQWSGGGKSISGTICWVHGGGHGDSSNNGMYAFDFAGTAAPTGWTLPFIGDPAQIDGDSDPSYSDGTPVSVHSYDGLVHASHNDRIYRFFGSPYPGGTGNAGHWRYSISGATWTQLTGTPTFGDARASCFYDPSSGNILVYNTNTSSCYFFRTGDETWSAAKSISDVTFETTGIWDSTRGRGILVGADYSVLFSVNFTSETASTSTFTATGSTSIIHERPCGFYDALLDRYWLFGGNYTSAGWTTIYEMHPTTWAITAHTLTGDTIAVEHNDQGAGSYGRFVWMPAYRAVGTVGDQSGAAAVIKLPAS